MDPVNQPVTFEQLDGAFAVATVPKAVVPLGSVRGFVVDKKLLTVDAYTTVFPIPSRAIDLNPALKQNPGYKD